METKNEIWNAKFGRGTDSKFKFETSGGERGLKRKNEKGKKERKKEKEKEKGKRKREKFKEKIFLRKKNFL